MFGHLAHSIKGGEVKLRKGDRFRLVKGEGMIGQKHVCTGTAIERVNGHDGITLIKFTAPDHRGKPCKYAVPIDWVAYEPPNTGTRRERSIA